MFENAKPQRRTVPINTRADLVEEHARANAELDELLKAEPPTPPQRRISDADVPSKAVLDKTAHVEALEAEMEASWVDFVLQARPLHEWRAFKERYPATDLPEDEAFGLNLEAVIDHFLPECIIDPALTPEDWERATNGGIWPGDLQLLASIVAGFYVRSFDVPKSRLVSAVRETFDAERGQLASSASPADDSTAGSPQSATTTTRLTGS